MKLCFLFPKQKKTAGAAQWTVENLSEPIGISTYSLKEVLPSEEEIQKTLSKNHASTTLSNLASVVEPVETSQITDGERSRTDNENGELKDDKERY